MISNKNTDIQHYDLNNLMSNSFFDKFLNALPFIGLVLNANREILYCNDNLMSVLNTTSTELIYGKCLGDVLKCVFAVDFNQQCGTTKACKYCDLLNGFTQCNRTHQKTEAEIRLSRYINGKLSAMDLKVVFFPFNFNEKFYAITTFNDISSINRLRILERIFFHDVINSINSVMGLSEIFENDPDFITKENLRLLNSASKRIYEEVQSQKLLLQAENHELIINISKISIREILQKCIDLTSLLFFSKKNHLLLKNSETIYCYTDQIILERVVINLIKNALESISEEESVVCDYKVSESNIIISVWNPKVISEDVQFHIFQRSFSTKGNGRGNGTYSIKILTEQYLSGSAYFKSTVADGTSFFVKLPISKQ